MIGGKECFEALANAGVDESDISLEVPPSFDMGDIAFPCFPLSKKWKKGPNDIAKEIAAKISPGALIESAKATGPYVNFNLKKSKIAELVLGKISSEKQHYGTAQDNKTIMVEFCSPNTNKPLHLGHLRNIAIGLSVSRLLENNGNQVVRSCLVNDRGIHICKSMLAYKKYGMGKEPDKKSDHFVGDFYVLFSNKVKDEPSLDTEAQDMLKRWEQGDEDIRALWQKMTQWTLSGFEQTYGELGVKFDRIYYESAIYDKGKEIVKNALQQGLLTEKDGAMTASLTASGLPDKVVMRTDGTSLYVTQDIYLALQKFKDYPLDLSLYVVGSEQNLHFKQLFAILGLLKYDIASKCRHLSYGMVYLPEGRMKSREGKVVDADDLIAEMKKLASFEIEQRHKIEKSAVQARAHAIAMGALKFYLLKNDVGKDITYDPKESISFEGETGPYVMYTYARISSILRKASVPESLDHSAFESDEHQIIALIGRYPGVVKDAAQNLKPFLVCHYLLELAQHFNEYYHKAPVLKAEGNKRDARLMLLYCIREVLRNGLGVLDIEVIEEM